MELYTLPIIIKTEKMLKDLKQYYPLSAYEKKEIIPLFSNQPVG